MEYLLIQSLICTILILRENMPSISMYLYGFQIVGMYILMNIPITINIINISINK